MPYDIISLSGPPLAWQFETDDNVEHFTVEITRILPKESLTRQSLFMHRFKHNVDNNIIDKYNSVVYDDSIN